MGRIHDKLHPQISSLKKEKGFTLVELLIVIAVLGVLASVIVIAINPLAQMRKARDTKRKANLAQIQQALELFRSDVGRYPTLTEFPATTCTAGSRLTHPVNTTTVYLSSRPCDPVNSGVLVYTYTPLTSYTYTLKACLENATDRERDQPDTCGGTPVSFTKSQP